MPGWLLSSILLSVGLTVLLNLLPRIFPGVQARMEGKLSERFQQDDGNNSQARVFFPWKLMLVGSIVLSLALNLFL